MEHEGEKFGAQESVSMCLQLELSGQLGHGGVGAFYRPQGNQPVGVSETQTCPDWGPDMFSQALWNPA
jgi:hypothetical protein